MVLVDTSVWIDYLRERRTDQVVWFEGILEKDISYGITSVIYQELLQGAESQKSYDRLDEYLSTQHFYEPLDPIESYREAARIYFNCRRSGITIRSTIDCLIAQVAIEHDLELLARDRDFTFISGCEPKLRLYYGPYPPPKSATSYVHEPKTPYRSS